MEQLDKKYFTSDNFNRKQRKLLEKAKKESIKSFSDKLTKISIDDPYLHYISKKDEVKEIYRNKQFLVIIFACGNGLKITVSRNEYDYKTKRQKGNISWDELQQIKNDIGYSEHTFVEFFPKESELIDIDSVRHLWLVIDENKIDEGLGICKK